MTLNGGGQVTLTDLALNTITVETGASLTLGTSLAIGNNTVTLVGSDSLLADSAGLTLAGGTISGLGDLADNTNLTGYGTVSIISFNSADIVTASAGTLEFTSAVDSSVATSFDIAAAAHSVLEFDAAVGTATTHPTITFEGADNGHGVLDLTAISLSDFHGVIANFDEGESIDVTGATRASLETNGTTLDVYNGLALIGTLTLSTSYAGDTFNVSSGAITVDDLAVTLDSTSATEGTTINVTAVTDDHSNVAGSVTYVWQTSADGLFDDVSLVGIGSSYTPIETDEGKALRLVTTYAADASGSESTTINLGTVADITLAFNTAASISGTAQQGQVLTAVNGTLNDSDAAVTGYQWQSSDNGTFSAGHITNIGTNSSTYTVTEADEAPRSAWSRPQATPTTAASPPPRPARRPPRWPTSRWRSTRRPRSAARRRGPGADGGERHAQRQRRGGHRLSVAELGHGTIALDQLSGATSSTYTVTEADEGRSCGGRDRDRHRRRPAPPRPARRPPRWPTSRWRSTRRPRSAARPRKARC